MHTLLSLDAARAFEAEISRRGNRPRDAGSPRTCSGPRRSRRSRRTR